MGIAGTVVQLSDLHTDVRSLLLEPNPRFFQKSEITTWLNQGRRDFAVRTLWFEQITCVPAIANQAAYPYPANTIKLHLIRWDDKFRLKKLNEAEWSQITFQNFGLKRANPSFYFSYPRSQSFETFPAPTSTSVSTTLTSAIGTTDTTINVVSTTGFTATGRIVIGGEQIRYYAVSPTAFLQCSRGDQNTPAAAAASGATAQQGQIYIYTKTIPVPLVNDSDTLFVDELAFDKALVYYAVAQGCFKRSTEESMKKGADYFKLYTELREEAAAELELKEQDGAGGVLDEEFGQGFFDQV